MRGSFKKGKKHTPTHQKAQETRRDQAIMLRPIIIKQRHFWNMPLVTSMYNTLFTTAIHFILHIKHVEETPLFWGRSSVLATLLLIFTLPKGNIQECNSPLHLTNMSEIIRYLIIIKGLFWGKLSFEVTFGRTVCLSTNSHESSRVAQQESSIGCIINRLKILNSFFKAREAFLPELLLCRWYIFTHWG